MTVLVNECKYIIFMVMLFKVYSPRFCQDFRFSSVKVYEFVFASYVLKMHPTRRK